MAGKRGTYGDRIKMTSAQATKLSFLDGHRRPTLRQLDERESWSCLGKGGGSATLRSRLERVSRQLVECAGVSWRMGSKQPCSDTFRLVPRDCSMNRRRQRSWRSRAPIRPKVEVGGRQSSSPKKLSGADTLRGLAARPCGSFLNTMA
jgi:hypothetical protein